MDVIFVVLPVALLLAGAALVVCVRSIQGGQFDDLETPALRILLDDLPPSQPGNAPPRDPTP